MKVRARLVRALLPLLGALLVSSAARAEPPELVWEAPPNCPGRADVLAQLSEVVGAETGASGSVPDLEQVLGRARARGVIARDGRAWVLTLQVGTGTAERQRRLDAESCATLGRAAALAFALLLERELHEAEPATEAPSTPVASQPSSAGTTPNGNEDALRSPTPEHETASATATQYPLAALGLEGVLDSATLGQAALGLGAALDVRFEAWSAGVFGRWLPAQRSSFGSATGYTEFEQWAVGLRVCPLRWGERWELVGCGSGEVGRVLGRGIGLVQPHDVSSPWFAAALGLGLRWNRPSGALQAGTELALPLERRRYVVDLADEVHVTPSATWRFTLGVDLDL